MKKISAFIALIIVGVTLLIVKGGSIVDQLNPFIKEGIYYAVVDNDGKFEILIHFIGVVLNVYENNDVLVNKL